MVTPGPSAYVFTRIRRLEQALATYAAKYGLTEEARDALDLGRGLFDGAFDLPDGEDGAEELRASPRPSRVLRFPSVRGPARGAG